MRRVVSLAGAALAVAAGPLPSLASTSICGTIAGGTWSPAGNPYVVCATGAVVPTGSTLTVQPGVVVQFAQGVGDTLAVQGTLLAAGTSDQPITFTGATASAGSWGGLSISASGTPAAATLKYVTIEYGGVNGSFGAVLSVDRGTLTLANAVVRNGAGSGIYATTNASLDVEATAFVGNGLDALRLVEPPGDLPLSGLTASGNGLDAVHVIGVNTTVHGQRRWMAPGIPYTVDTPVVNTSGDTLTIDPGSELDFHANTGFAIGGALHALGTAGAPILFTGQTSAPGAWNGILAVGGGGTAVVQLEYVTVENGGGDIAGANIEVMGGQVVANHTIIRNGRLDGVLVDSNASVSVTNGQIVGHSRYGVENKQPTRAVLASNDWWGDPSGPASDVPGCSTGGGDRVTDGVLFRPVLADPNVTAPVPLTAAPTLTLTPRRWFAPADGVTRVYFDVTLRDGNGAPIPGRTVELASTLGTPVDGGITDADGKTLAYLTSSSAGDATVRASLLATTACEAALSPTAEVTFTTPLSITDLFPDSPAPYFSNQITVTPRPIVTGVPETINATLVNPLPQPITVDVSFGFVQSAIGLAFGPIADFPGQVIAAGGSVTLHAPWVPAVSGHYCFRVSYDVTAVGPAVAARSRQVKPQTPNKQDHNDNTQQGPESSTDGRGRLDKTRNALKVVSKVPGAPTKLHGAMVDQGLLANLSAAEKISGNLNPDPPRQDYQQLDAPQKLTLPPVQPGPNLSAARAAALTALHDAMAEVNAQGSAAVTAFDRYGGASDAHDLQWASLQSAALLEYKQHMGDALAAAAGKIDDLLAVAASEGDTSAPISRDDVVAIQQQVAAGFSSDQIATFHAVGLDDADIEAVRQETIAADPDALAGDLVLKLQQVRDAFLGLGDAFTHPDTFTPPPAVGGVAGSARPVAAAPADSMIHLHDAMTTVQLGNPLATTTAIDVRARRVDLPADWAVEVSPAQATLAPGAQMPVTVTVVAGSPVPQGSNPKVAVEGWAGSQLLGGVAVDVVVPYFATLPTTTTTLPQLCNSIETCYTALGAALPPPKGAASRKARRIARNLARRYRKLGQALKRAAAAPARKRRKRYTKAGKLAQQLLAAAESAAGKGRLGVPLGPVEAAADALLAQIAAAGA
ncbi:MAG TPA: Ig-like domain-containing protein [Candidatus Binatia bacterium]|nr:Ig-like domain-containing protein [Candidatus Binatia bacterium]